MRGAKSLSVIQISSLISRMPEISKFEEKSRVAEPFPWQSLFPQPVIGLDEVGRGCLAGPVYASAVIVPEDAVAILERSGVTDSKKIAEKKRDLIAEVILANCHVGLGFASSEEIDRHNILQATFLAMRRALVDLANRNVNLAGFGPAQGHILIDGNQRLPFSGAAFDSCSNQSEIQRFSTWSKLPQTTLVKGDLRALPVAAASIVAKVTRDRLMIELDQEFPEYGFKGHKGYAAEIHRTAIKEFGPSPVHRKSFAGVKEFVVR